MTNIIVKQGMPRKGWHTVSTIDHGDISESCELCGTRIRHEHIIEHPQWPEFVSTGCVCAEHLSSDYVWRNAKKWKTVSNDTVTVQFRKIKKLDTAVVENNGVYSWFIHDTESGDTYDSREIGMHYPTSNDAQDAMFDLLDNEGWL
jgi:hypothetical protein